MTEILTPSMASVVWKLKARAGQEEFHGRESEIGMLGRHTIDHDETGTRVLYTHDSGHHTSGWLRNPDYERCLHLSLSFYDPEAVQQAAIRARLTGHYGVVPSAVSPRPFEQGLAKVWVEAFFGEAKRYVWEESPKSPEGKSAGVRHYRVFTDRLWIPMLPRGEVYSEEFTELGWKSWSEQHDYPMPTEAMRSAQ